MNRLRSLVSLLLLAALQVGAAFALVRFGEVERWKVPWGDLGPWLDATPRTDVAVGLGRWAALAVVVYLLASTALYLLACLTRVPALVRATGTLTLPTLRRAVEGTVAVGLSASVVLGAHAAGAAPVSGWADRSAATVQVQTARGAVTDPATASAVAPSPTASGSWEVAKGDNLWDMACGVVSKETGVAEPALEDYQIAPYWHAIMEANPAPSGDPNLIYPHWQVVLPPFDPAVHAPGLTVLKQPAPDLNTAPANANPFVQAPDEAPPTTIVASTPTSVVTFSEPPAAPPTTITSDHYTQTTAVVRGPARTSGSEPTVVEHPVAPQTAEPTPTVAPALLRTQQSSRPYAGMGVLAAGILYALWSARRWMNRHRRPNEVTEAPEAGAAEVEVALVLNADEAQAEFVSLALRALTGVTKEEEVAPLGVTVDDDELTVILAAPATASAPFEGYGTTWVLPRTTDPDVLTEAAGDAPFGMPALVCLGTTDYGASVYVDLEEAGLVSVVGEGAAEVVYAALLGLATAPWPDRSSVIAAGYPSNMEPPAGVRSVMDASVVVDELNAEAHRIGNGLRALGMGSTFEARCREPNDDADPWAPTVLVCAEPPDPGTARRLVDLVSSDTAGVAVITVGPIGAEADWAWELRCENGTMDVPRLGLIITDLQQVSVPTAVATVSLLDNAQRPPVCSVELEDAPANNHASDYSLATSARPKPEVIVRVLGPVRIDGADFPRGQDWSHRTKAIEALAALVLHPDKQVDGETLFGWLWPDREPKPGESLLRNTTEQLRRFLRMTYGAAPDGTCRHLRPKRGNEKFYDLDRELVGCDFLTLKQALADARYENETTAKALLREALEWVVGPKMFDHATKGYTWVERDYLRTDAERMVVDAAARLARLYLDDPEVIDATEALRACDVGFRVCPGHEELSAIAMEAHHLLGNWDGVEAVWDALKDDEPSPDVVEAHERYGKRLVSVAG